MVTRVIQTLNRGGRGDAGCALRARRRAQGDPGDARRPTSWASSVDGIDDVAIRLPQCCRPVPGDDVVGYISLGRGITVHRRDCPNVRALEKNPERFAAVHWDSIGKTPLRVEIQIEAYDRNHLLEDISRTLSESGVSILAAQMPRGARTTW